MAFSPTLDICFENCSRIKFVDTTNVYNATTNSTGWGSANSAEGINVDTAIITVYDSTDSAVITYDVSSQIPDTVIGEIGFTDYTATTLDDGEYKLEYVITFNDSSIYTFSKYFCSTCNFEGCIDKLIATIPDKICSNRCDTDYIDEVLLVEGLLYGYKCAATCEKATIKNEIKLRLERFCDFNCNCN